MEGGSANDYDYCKADPINCTDIAGTAGQYDVVDTFSGQDVDGNGFVDVIPLRRGNTRFNWARLGWDGWGYRKIVAKHGWGPLQRSATAETLASGRMIARTATSVRYEKWLRLPCGCGKTRRVKWIVVVEHGSGRRGDRYWAGDQMKGIITSYGEGWN